LKEIDGFLQWMQKAIAVLKKLEWSSMADFQLYQAPGCPVCKGIKKTETPVKDVWCGNGHKPGCELAWLLENKPASTVVSRITES